MVFITHYTKFNCFFILLRSFLVLLGLSASVVYVDKSFMVHLLTACRYFHVFQEHWADSVKENLHRDLKPKTCPYIGA